MHDYKKDKKEFYEKVKTALVYTGSILTVMSAIAYLVVVAILVYGFETKVDSNQLLVFLGLGAFTGVLMNLSMRIQGIDFAKELPDSKEVLEELTNLTGKSDKVKLYPIWVMFLKTILQDIFIKGGSIMVTLYFSIEIVINGLGDNKYFYLGIVNVLLYLGLGMLSLAKAYDYYIEKHIPYMQQRINRLKEGDKNELLKGDKRVDSIRVSGHEGSEPREETCRDNEQSG